MARQSLVAIGLLLICIIAILLFKRSVKEGFVLPINATEIITSAYINQPLGLVLDNSEKNLYVLGGATNKISKVDLATGTTTTFAGSGKGDSIDGQGTAAAFHNLQGISIDSSGNLYVADQQNKFLRKVDTSANVSFLVGYVDAAVIKSNEDMWGIKASAIDNSKNIIYILRDSSTVHKVDLTAKTCITFVSDSVTKFNQPQDIVIDNTGQTLYVADTYNHRIRKIDIATKQVTTLAGTGSRGNVDNTGISASFNDPVCITIDKSSKNLYIGDLGNNTIRKIAIATGKVTTIYRGYDGPRAITIDRSGNLYVAYVNSGKIVKLEVLPCQPGYNNIDDDCVKCEPGKYSPDGSLCKECDIGTYSEAGALKCITCPAGLTTLKTGSTKCVCLENSYLDNGKCVACPEGAVSSAGSTSISECTCPANKYLDNGKCMACPSGSVSSAGSISITGCKCPENNYMKDGKCTACPEGAVSSGGSSSISACKCPPNNYMSNAQCTSCPEGSTSSLGSSSISSCICAPSPGSIGSMNTLTPSSSSCTASSCLPGYSLTSGKCSECGAGLYSQTGATTCSTCEAGTYSGVRSSGCTSCGNGTYSGSGASKCMTCEKKSGAAIMSSSKTSCTIESCLPGNEISGGECKTCGADFYGEDGKTCTSCPNGSTSSPGSDSISACKCPANSYGTNGSCTKCETGTVSKAGSTSESDCICPPGTTRIVMGSRSVCMNIDQVNKYSMKAYDPFARSTYNNGPKTSIVLIKNTDLCPPNSTDPCCKQESSTNNSCINRNFWKLTQVFDTNVSGFEDYRQVPNLGTWL